MFNSNRGGGGRSNFGGRNSRGGSRGRGRGRADHRPGSEICRRYVTDECEFTPQGNGRPCRFVHFIKKIGENNRNHTGPIKDVLLWNQTQLFTCSQDGTIKLIDCTNWQEITTLSIKDSNVIPVNTTNNNNFGSASRHQKQSKSQISNDTDGGVNALVLEGPFLFVGYEGPCPYNTNVTVGYIRAWNVATPTAIPLDFQVSPEWMPYASPMSVLALAVATDAAGVTTLFSGSGDGSIRYWGWEATSNSFKARGLLEGHARGITRLKTVVIGTTTILASASIDGTIRLWDLATYKCVKMFTALDNGHTSAVTDIEFWVNAGEQFLISGGLDCEVIVWSLAPPFQQLFKETQDVEVTALCGAQDTKGTPILFIGTSDGSMIVKELPTFAYKTTLYGPVNYGHSDAVRRISCGPHNTLFSVGNDRKMIAWQITGDIASIPQQH